MKIAVPRSRRFQFQLGLPEFLGNEMNDPIFNLELTRDA
jgi:hypothetical protein